MRARYGGAHGGRDNSREVTRCLNTQTRCLSHIQKPPVTYFRWPGSTSQRFQGPLKQEHHQWGAWGVGRSQTTKAVFVSSAPAASRNKLETPEILHHASRSLSAEIEPAAMLPPKALGEEPSCPSTITCHSWVPGNITLMPAFATVCLFPWLSECCA